jgi:hypothetical protein
MTLFEVEEKIKRVFPMSKSVDFRIAGENAEAQAEALVALLTIAMPLMEVARHAADVSRQLPDGGEIASDWEKCCKGLEKALAELEQALDDE